MVALAYTRGHALPAPPDGVTLQPASAGMRCVGHPLGSGAFCRQYYEDHAQKTGKAVEAIARVADYKHPIALQVAYLQLRYCAEPRIAHLLRVADPAVIDTGAVAHDGHILRGLDALLGPGDLLQLSGSPAAIGKTPHPRRHRHMRGPGRKPTSMPCAERASRALGRANHYGG
eukprot:COSAG05_NODE_646_length_8119_cov_236.689900_8_plen_173_part_00